MKNICLGENMEHKPKISIITASKNGGRFLRQTIESILNQTFTDYEHVLVDGESTDDTLTILKEYDHIRWISEPDRHADEGFYKALTMAQGEYIMLCCVSDGYLNQDWFAKCIKVLDDDPEVSLVYGLAQCMSEKGQLGKVVCSTFLNHLPPQKMDCLPFWLGTYFLPPESTFCVRADVFRKCFPKFESSGHFVQNHALFAFNYNFHVHGYLPYFLPVVASFGRYHHDSSSSLLTELNRPMKQQYFAAIVEYRDEVLSGKARHLFRDGQSNVIGAVEPHQLKLYRQKVLDYRINRRALLGKRQSPLSYWTGKIRILAADLISRY